jgi:hypothetical protein
MFGILFPFVIGWFFYEWFESKKIAYVSTLLASVNPLLWQMSRLMYDAPYTVFFYMLGGALFLRAKSKRLLVGSFLAFFLGFLGYQGYKLLFVPWILLLVWRKKRDSLKNLHKNTWLFGIICISLFMLYVLVLLPNQHVANRFSNTIFSDNDYIAAQVNEERRLSVENPFMHIFSNKLISVIKFMVEKFVNAFNTNIVFWTGEPAQSKFAVWGHGWFYVADMILLIAGLVSLAYQRKHLRPVLGLVCFIVFATLPSLVNSGNSWYLLRMFFPNVLLIGVLSMGFMFLARNRILLMTFVGFYAISIAYFGYYYYYRYPVLGQNTGYLSERVIIDYITRVRKFDSITPVYVHTVDVPVMLWSYVVYSDFYSKEKAQEFATFSEKDEVKINNIIFTTRCADPSVEGIVINEAWRVPCESQREPASFSLSLPSIIDNGTYWHMYNDTLCEKFANRPFITVNAIENFKIDKQSDQSFCNQWFARFN